MDNSPNQYAIREGGQDPWRLVMLLVATRVNVLKQKNDSVINSKKPNLTLMKPPTFFLREEYFLPKRLRLLILPIIIQWANTHPSLYLSRKLPS